MSILTDKCPTCGQRKRRTVPQNSRYFALVRAFAGKVGYSTEVVHEYFKRKFLPMVEVEFPDWTTRLLPTSTSKLPMHRGPDGGPNWDDYTMEVEVFCAENGVYLEE
jgi:hypothetical protein